MASDQFTAVWPLKAKKKEHVVVPTRLISKHKTTTFKKGDVVKYRLLETDLERSAGLFLLSGGSAADVDAMFATDAPKRFSFPSRQHVDIHQRVSSSENESQSQKLSQRMINAAKQQMMKKAKESNTSQILKQFQQRTISHIEAASAGVRKEEVSIGKRGDRRTLPISKQFHHGNTSLSLNGEKTNDVLDMEVVSANPEVQEGSVAGQLKLATKSITVQREKSIQKPYERPSSGPGTSPLPDTAGECSSASYKVDIEGLLQEMKKIQMDIIAREVATAALAKQSAEDAATSKQTLQLIKMEREEMIKQQEKLDETRALLESEGKIILSSLQEAVNESTKLLDEQRLKVVAEMTKKISEFEGISTSRTSSASSRSISSTSSKLPDDKAIDEDIPMGDDDAPNRNEKISIGNGISVSAHYWKLGKSASSQGQWARYALEAAFGEDARLYRATTPRSKLYKFKIFPSEVVSILQKHYRLFLKAHPRILWAPKRKRTNRKSSNNNQLIVSSDGESEDESSNSHTLEEERKKIKELVEGLPGKMADKATELWRKWLSENRHKQSPHSKESSTESATDNIPTARTSPSHEEHDHEEVNTDASCHVALVGSQTPSRNSDNAEDDSDESSYVDLSPHSSRLLNGAGYSKWNNNNPIQDFDTQEGFVPQTVSTQRGNTNGDLSDGSTPDIDLINSGLQPEDSDTDFDPDA